LINGWEFCVSLHNWYLIIFAVHACVNWLQIGMVTGKRWSSLSFYAYSHEPALHWWLMSLHVSGRAGLVQDCHDYNSWIAVRQVKTSMKSLVQFTCLSQLQIPKPFFNSLFPLISNLQGLLYIITAKCAAGVLYQLNWPLLGNCVNLLVAVCHGLRVWYSVASIAHFVRSFLLSASAVTLGLHQISDICSFFVQWNRILNYMWCMWSQLTLSTYLNYIMYVNIHVRNLSRCVCL
jgi:hypothetical protein